ncbi:cyclopropane-fatty-acyl-phospholipid synthase [Tamaricihabitans halophyticus]|uniref:Cyclopropane-fatty-acyl-phospholipid synthase n=1 Tax=Tamaricihabitans halophyticus TaxID=1262583 RepID=A0A4R2QCT3_9PSEU|nr:class I SAM-dependent methyltransferase [Tamaricihabitans halophyticus]TCP44771.1 cyclopropane-fatty-acyl-phospholipid synthase [Tamaricihabitans halophyticus]
MTRTTDLRARRTDGGLADRLGAVLERVLGMSLPLGLHAWDGSRTGPSSGPQVLLQRRRAVRFVLWSPGELGLARAFVAGDVVVDGDLGEALEVCRRWADANAVRAPRLTPATIWLLGSLAARLGALGPPPALPRSEARPRGRVHTRIRDKFAISHHYDTGNAFFELLLDPRMNYSCGYWENRTALADEPSRAGEWLARAQVAKLDHICRKLALRPGMRLLDIGCGWGALIIHAARQYGVHATGITLSAEQHDYVSRLIDRYALGSSVEVRRQDYRDLPSVAHDAVASVEMGEHVGAANYPRYAATLYRMLAPGGHLLLQQMSRGNAAGGGPFIESYIAPDMTMNPIGRTADMLEAAGFELAEIEAMREHYVWTIRAWRQRLAEQRDRAVELIGEERLRVWSLYLAGGELAFADNRMGVHQVLATRPAAR